MNGTRRRRSYLAAAAAGASLALVLTACSDGDDGGGGSDDASSDVDCTAFEQYGDLERQVDQRLHVDRRPRVGPADRLVQAVRGVHGRDDRVRGLAGVRGAAARPPAGRQPARHRVHPAARLPGVDRRRLPGHRRRGAAGGHRQRQRVLHRGLGQLRHGRRHALRDAARRQREVVRLVLAVGVRGERLRDPHHVGRPHGPHRPDRQPTTPTPSRGARASSPVTPPAGRPPTGSRTCCCAPPVRTSTTSGSTHEIPFNDPQVLDALQTVGGILKNDEYVNGGLGDVQSIATAPWNEAGNGIPDGTCFLHRAANFYQANWDPSAQGRGGRRRLRVLPAGQDGRRQAAARRWRVRDGLRRPSRGRRRSRRTCPARSGPTPRPRPPARAG